MHPVDDSHVFLSYARQDVASAKLIRDKLDGIGFSIWFDQKDIPGGSVWRDEIDLAISRAGALLVLQTAASDLSRYVVYEWTLALGMGIPVLPIAYGSANAHPRLLTLQQIAYDPTSDEFWNSLRSMLEDVFNPYSREIRIEQRRLRSRSLEVRKDALAKLYVIDHPQARQLVLDELNIGPFERRLEAAKVLVQHGSPEGANLVLEALSSVEAGGQAELIDMLAKGDPAPLLERMVDALCATNNAPRLRWRYAKLLATHGGRSESLLRKLPSTGDKARDLIVADLLWALHSERVNRGSARDAQIGKDGSPQDKA